MRNAYTIAFYNLENLFDIHNDPRVLDNDFLPNGEKGWTEKRYENKIFKLGKAIAKIGQDEYHLTPALVGVAEVENDLVLEDLIISSHLKDLNYSYVHYNSPDERGIDVALLVNDDLFEVLDSQSISIDIFEEDGVRDYTRDALYVKGKLNNEIVHVIVTHWPSRREGASQTSHKRVQAAKQIRDFLFNNQEINNTSKIIIMGDFNDNPNNESIKDYLLTSNLFNPFEQLMSNNRGSLMHYDEWYLFDQIILSHNFLKSEVGKHHFLKANIFDDFSLQEWDEDEKGSPFRTYRGRKYQGGFSDHFPVFITFTLK